MPSSRTQRSPAQWQALIDQQINSGWSAYAFCRHHQITASAFYHWKKRLAEADTLSPEVPASTPPTPGATSDPTTGFMPLNLPTQDAFDRPDDPSVAAPSAWEIELDLGNGMCLRLRRGGA